LERRDFLLNLPLDRDREELLSLLLLLLPLLEERDLLLAFVAPFEGGDDFLCAFVSAVGFFLRVLALLEALLLRELPDELDLLEPEELDPEPELELLELLLPKDELQAKKDVSN
jgi:hypothetical protein